MGDYRPRLKGKIKKAYENLIKKERRILVIGDLHEPFCLDGYLEHCKEVYAKHNCNKVIFIGDVIDNHYSSYHEQDPDGMGGGDELDLAIKKLSRWYKAFPHADVCIGNHDRLIRRKAFSSGVPKRWIKGFSEVLETSRWNYDTRFVYDNVQYIHCLENLVELLRKLKMICNQLYKGIGIQRCLLSLLLVLTLKSLVVLLVVV